MLPRVSDTGFGRQSPSPMIVSATTGIPDTLRWPDVVELGYVLRKSIIVPFVDPKPRADY